MTARTGDVLVLRALGLGDALTGIAALRGIRRAWPDRRTVLACRTELGDWLRGLGLVDAVLPARGLEPLDGAPTGAVAVNLHGRGPQSHRLLQSLEPARLVAFRNAEADHPDGPAWRADEHEVLRWCRLVSEAGGACGPEDLRLPSPAERSDLVVVHPGAASASRRWPAERWKEVVAALAGRGLDVAVTGSQPEAALCAQVAAAATGLRNLCGQLDFTALAELVGTARLLLCGDTGVAHLATAYATPSVLLFGPTSPALWGPVIDPELHVVLWHGDSGAAYAGDPHADVVDPLLARIEVDEVLDTAVALLRRSARSPARSAEVR